MIKQELKYWYKKQGSLESRLAELLNDGYMIQSVIGTDFEGSYSPYHTSNDHRVIAAIIVLNLPENTNPSGGPG